MNRTVTHLNPAALLLLSLLACGCAGTSHRYPGFDVSVENMKRTVHYLSSVDPPRNFSNIASLEASARYVTDELTRYGITARHQGFEVSGKTYRNVIGSVGPAQGSRMIVGAHYDVCGDQPGADDNASAVAGLLETARLAKMHESELPLGVDFVAYTLEEPPFFRTPRMGSYVHARSLHENGVDVRGMISLEMIGYYRDEKNTQRYPTFLMRPFYGSRGDFIGVVGNFGSASLARRVARHLGETSLRVKKLYAPAWVTGVDFSDHRNFWEFGYDAVMVTDTSFYRNPNYHRRSDTIETLDFDRMKEVVRGVCWLLLNMR